MKDIAIEMQNEAAVLPTQTLEEEVERLGRVNGDLPEDLQGWFVACIDELDYRYDNEYVPF